MRVDTKLWFLVSHPMSAVVFMLPHLKVLHPHFKLEVLANTQEGDLLRRRGLDVGVTCSPVERPIRPWADIKALWWLYRKLRSERPNALHTLTPKAGLLGMIAAWLAGVPVRVHTFTGQVWVTRQGIMRWVLKLADRCIAALATDVMVDSPSQQAFLIEQGIVSANKSVVLGEGSICGVDTHRFAPSLATRHALRAEMGTAEDRLVCLYLGRLNRDKGVFDLAAAFSQLAEKHVQAELWVVGPDEDDAFSQMQLLFGAAADKVKRVGFTPQPERFMQAADLFCLPSYREGFGSSVIEAASCGIPALVSRIYGLTDAVVEGQTGWMHEAGNVTDLAQQLDEILSNPNELVKKGLVAQTYVSRVFSQKMVTKEMLSFYQSRLGQES